MDNALITIAMPVRNCETTLPIAVRSLLNQTYEHWELLLIDDGSTDTTLSVASGFSDPRIKLTSDGKSQGLAARLNHAIDLSQGEYIARMDGDDVAYPLRLERQVQFLEQHREVDLVGTGMLVFGAQGTPLGKRGCPESHEEIVAKPFVGFPLAHPTFVGRLDWFRRFRYRPQAIRCEDQDLLLRSYRQSRFANLGEILLGYREEKIELSKILLGRLNLTRSLVHELARQRRLDLCVRAVLGHSGRAALDYLAVATGLHHRLLRRRARAITEAERQEWEHVWQSVSTFEH